MNRFLKYIGILILPIVLVWLSVEVFYRMVPNNYSFKHQEMINKSNNIEVLILGDSHAMYGINPKWIDKPTFNLANLSQTIYFDKLLFEKYLDSLENLKYIVIPMEYTTMSQVDNSQEDIWRKYFYATQMDLDVPYLKWYNPKKYSLALSQKFKRTVNALDIYRQTNTLVNCDNNGWGLGYIESIDVAEIDDLAKIISRKHDDGSLDISINLERIKDIIQICESRDIRVVIINFPVTNQYLNALNENEMENILYQSKLLDSKSRNVKNINLINDKRFELSDFHDADHLNVQGAKKCSLILNDYLESL